MQEHDELQSRLRNCLQTILELEPDLEDLEIGHDLMKELNMLKTFMKKLDSVDLEEDDVLRIEKATANFLKELEGPLSLYRKQQAARHYLQ
ncbi:hypothetical protein Dde_2073 [Oleidesulfovibrio alaskensis G20]|uniref:Uncharacterized protein n=1 Tax=Oleidesulfovibrio alaskensis (strain ATCC BAA-1058 / DSM 17464 / G20) TaxID=207559 RepID=Q30ZM6_OLEA2|nr:hypothetical protein [Oleidesulfovibrio alaskensis]ABB38870.1 hypothetical protein Dde_2073 [Oleidesulfovibrio alaskensis G20]MBG0772339.1 hypothetical protein [Oleidesulfovibrio alaskensis]MBL3582745.1 hypothetical protein [Oleidesulfovibrio alaskensis]